MSPKPRILTGAEKSLFLSFDYSYVRLLKKCDKNIDEDKIHIGKPLVFDIDKFLDDLDDLMDAAYANDKEIKRLVAGMVCTYHQEGVDDVSSETYRKLVSQINEEDD